ncbi:MAG: stage II sporulation protein E (SpoIIE) [Candidatus Methanoperedens sp.]|nr:stage II sporulation protein E (SpoIIE) [Candidatus Methanoperedens sp.]
MCDETADPLRSIEFGLVTIPLQGESVSGDDYIIKPFHNGVLVAVVDGLGHGYEAARASGIAIAALDTYVHESIIPLVKHCHDALKGTRGVVMSIAKFNLPDNTLSWLGVGNIECVLLRADEKFAPSHERLLLRGGVLGYQLPTLRESIIPVMRGDTLVFATDGIRSGFEEGLKAGERPQQIADNIMTGFSRGTDDALVLVVRVVRYICK